MRIVLLISIWLGMVMFNFSSGQVVFETYHSSVYNFLDEMAAEGYIRINTYSKPFDRKFIAQRLEELSAQNESLNKRQQDQLAFYLKDFGKESHIGKDWDRRLDLFYYSDSTFQVTVNPILEGSFMANQNDTRSHRKIGIGFQAKAGKFGFYGSLRDNSVSQVLAAPNMLTPLEGQNYKTISSDNRSDYNEAIGGISYQWKWGDISLLKDRYVWGNAARSSNVFSGKAPSYAAISYRLYPVKWLDFQYMHGWLISEELDSARTYLTPNGSRKIYMNKNIAANYFTIKSKWKVDFTFGNSIIYSDNGIQPVYFIPFMFFKSADHTYNGTGSNELGQNAQMFFDISSRAIKKVHMYASLFVDEVSLSNMWDSDQQTNIMSLKVGATWYNFLPNFSLTGEYTRTNPWTYRHQIQSTTFASNDYTLGHYLGENADEIFGRLRWKPWQNLTASVSGWLARKGPEHVYEIVNGNANVSGLGFMESVEWQQLGLQLQVDWEVKNDVTLFIGATYMETSGDERYNPSFTNGVTTTGECGLRIGW